MRDSPTRAACAARAAVAAAARVSHQHYQMTAPVQKRRKWRKKLGKRLFLSRLSRLG